MLLTVLIVLFSTDTFGSTGGGSISAAPTMSLRDEYTVIKQKNVSTGKNGQSSPILLDGYSKYPLAEFM
jgi:hypothetical protein